MSKASLAFRGRNPDVLSCIANLSNEFVFTPPDLANRMLDSLAEAWAASNGGENIWSNSAVTFLDPCTKTGVFLREIVRRLADGLRDEIPDLGDRVDHILTKQVLGIATIELTSLLARRSVYCSKFANGEHSVAKSFHNAGGNIWFERTEHTWSSSGRCSYCRANRADYERGAERETYAYAFIHADDPQAFLNDAFGADMKFDVVIGNPPYQLGSTGGDAPGSFAMPIYQRFVGAAKALDPRYVVMITPSRWFAGGRGLDQFRAEMLADPHMRELVDFPDANEVFPGMDIAGGVSYFVWDQLHNGPCLVRTEGAGLSSEPMARYLNAYDVLVRYNTGVAILEKVWPDGVGAGSLAAKVSPTQPFGLRTSFRGEPSAAGMTDPITVRTSEGDQFMERTALPRNADWADEWKVLLGLAYGERGSFPYWITAQPIILGPGTACTETYLVIDRFDTEDEAVRFAAYLRTRFVRFLVSLRKYTQHLYSERFAFVPDLPPMDRLWTDEELYAKYGLAPDEIAFIEKMVREMAAPNG